MKDSLPTDIFTTGQILNNTYEILGVLGRGGTGEVYKARNKVTGRIFAIKALNATFSGNSDYVGLMKREEEMRAISHGAVVRYNECSMTDVGNVILVMDFIDGPSLADAMDNRRFEAKELLIIAHRVAEGLVAAHAHGIVHRDLSPDNIILRDGLPENATIIDFGIAKDTTAGARTVVGNEFAGKYEYAAPEQLDGAAEPRSDLYALGATLLAVFRRETPYLGTTPGEIVRRKQAVLDTNGVDEPLKSVIETLTAPDPADRPGDAAAAASMIDEALRPASRGAGSRRTRRDKGRTRRGKGMKFAAGAAGIIALIALLLFAGQRLLFGPGLPTVTPYTLTATDPGNGQARLDGHAPDDTAATVLAQSFMLSTAAPPEAVSVTLADGMPAGQWIDAASGLITALAGLDSWTLNMADFDASIVGVAPDFSQKQRVESALNQEAGANGVALVMDVLAGPERLTADDVSRALSAVQTCGPLRPGGSGTYPLGGQVPVSGDIASAGDEAAIEAALLPVIGSRRADLDLTVLNGDLCAIRAVLPDAPSANLSIWLGNGADGSANLAGVYQTGQNPIAEVRAPASIDEGYLWVMIVDNTGKVFHILPNIRRTEQRLAALGEVEGGVRTIDVLHSVASLADDPTGIAVTVNDGDYGKSELIAILSRTPLFDIRRPRDESVASVAEALADALRGRESDILGVATRVIEARQ